MGTVEQVGLKTTRIRSLSGEQISVANSDLVSSRVSNYKRMRERRIVFRLGLIYQTPPAKLREAKTIITETISARDDARFDRAHFFSYGDFSLVFEVVYYVLSADYNLYMDVQEAVNLEIYERFEKAGLEFAYPTQTIFVGKAEGGSDPAITA
jgi:small-conductance mechanosensitive channel